MSKRDFPEFSGTEETIVGVHHSGVELQEGLNTSTRRNLCANCRRNTHCYVKIDKDTHEAVVHNTCKDKICECKCKTHYSCRICGYLHPYGSKCDREEIERKLNPKADAEFEKFMKGWRKETDKKNSLTKVPKKK